MYYKKFRSRRPAEINSADSPFYLVINHRRKPNDSIWYMKAPLGKNEIGKLMKAAARGACLQGNITNHSFCKTSISRLMDAEVPVNYVVQLSGHKNLKSLDSYKAASIEHQRKMSYILSCSGEQSLQSSKTRSSSLVQESSSHSVNLSQRAVNPNEPFAVFSLGCLNRSARLKAVLSHLTFTMKPKKKAQKEKNQNKPWLRFWSVNWT